MTTLNTKQSNLSEMHAGSATPRRCCRRSGRPASSPAPVTVAAAIALGDQWVVAAPSTASMFVGQKPEFIGQNPSGDVEEIVTVTAVDAANSRSARYSKSPPPGPA